MRRRIQALLAVLALLLVVTGCTNVLKPAVETNGNVQETNNGTNVTDGNGGSTSSNEPQSNVDPPSQSHNDETDSPSTGNEEDQASEDAGQPVQTNPDDIAHGVWMAVGDIMMHMPQLPGAYNSKKKRYVFDPFFSEVRPILEEGDWTLANLETPITGKDLGYTGFPKFNAPPELAEALKNAGFTIVTNANNHSLDRNFKGIERTLANLEKHGLITKGTSRSQAEADRNTIIEQNGIRMGLLAYSYGTNGIPLPKGKPYSVSLIEEQAIIQDIHKLRKAGTDFITVALHFGTEYETTPNEKQKSLARNLIAAGADIIAGSHTHVVQPYETIEVTEPDGSVRQGLIIYSMGNFISNQRGDTKDYGVIFKAGIQKNNVTGITTIGPVEAIPTWVHRYKADGTNRYTIVPLRQSIEKRSIPYFSANGYTELQRNLSVLSKRLQSMADIAITVDAITLDP
ncbi:CapA family protein [Paenibacillus spongiae]|uniref:CapA family protein n=1 Tax=Paenibacillus spongiae TaxID=2909671 RepID=A0ABY5S645_9BACL|nr:CapA family protein [Paenibacillus spongiae]UVI27793.1 CapA family protein [Paenibacillus spongiae]